MRQTRHRVTKAIGLIHRSVSPIGMLPPETLRQIIRFTVTPRDSKGILSLASVCDLWRSAILTERHLFNEANWRKRDKNLLVIWCERAGNALLSIVFNRECSVRVRKDKAYVRTLSETKKRWGVLNIHTHERRAIRQLNRLGCRNRSRQQSFPFPHTACMPSS